MKKYLIVLLVFIIFAGCTAQTTTTSKPTVEIPKELYNLDITTGLKLIYDYPMQSELVKLEIYINNIAPDYVYTYKMSEPYNLEAQRTISVGALDSASIEFSEFYGNDKEFDNAFSMIFSRKRYAELKDNDTTLIYSSGVAEGEKDFLVKTSEETYEVLVDGMLVDIPCIKVEERIWRTFHYWILDNDNYPIILKRDGINNFELTEIKLPR